ncbi:hypothetical protein BJY52DRAFT_272474 [Lactarius psammicola]|nr:hypothetical protein BJY52DRAFT_272474 [Lactarius psammicola]
MVVDDHLLPHPAALLPPHERASPPLPVWKAPTRDDQRRRGLAVIDAPLDGVRRAPARALARRPCLSRQATTRARQAEHTRETAAAGACRACALVGRMVQRARCQLELSAHDNSLTWDSLFGFAPAIASFRSGWKQPLSHHRYLPQNRLRMHWRYQKCHSRLMIRIQATNRHESFNCTSYITHRDTHTSGRRLSVSMLVGTIEYGL